MLIRTMTIRHSALLAIRSPPRFSRCRLVLPEEAGSGATPHTLAKAGSLDRRSGLSPAATKTVRSEILDWTLIHGRRHLDRVLRTYASHYNAERPHRGLELAVPESRSPIAPVDEVPEIARRDLIGGLIREYHAVAS
jgi:hypothetical protein